jgi:hypothetical protein
VVLPAPNLEDDISIYFGDSKTLRTPAHRNMVIKFVRDRFPRARFVRIYDAATNGWKNTDFHRCCDKMGWTLTILETTKSFILGGFTTAEWESPPPSKYINKPDPHSFLFSVNEGSKYPIRSGDTTAIRCHSDLCAMFGKGCWNDLGIFSDSNNITYNFCDANRDSFKLPAAKGSKYPTINGGDNNFKLKEFEVYKVYVRITIKITFRNNERRKQVRLTSSYIFIIHLINISILI